MTNLCNWVCEQAHFRRFVWDSQPFTDISNPVPLANDVGRAQRLLRERNPSRAYNGNERAGDAFVWPLASKETRYVRVQCPILRYAGQGVAAMLALRPGVRADLVRDLHAAGRSDLSAVWRQV